MIKFNLCRGTKDIHLAIPVVSPNNSDAAKPSTTEPVMRMLIWAFAGVFESSSVPNYIIFDSDSDGILEAW